ncbi:MAG TPA: hypothetical protein VF091_05090 [Gaiellaceae bacterium]
MTRMYRKSVFVFGVLAVVIGFVLLFRTAQDGGGGLGYVLGALFVALGTARLYLLRKT